MVRAFVLTILITTSVFSQVKFEDFFYDKTLRVDYFHTGDSTNDYYSIDELIEEPYWGGSKVNLIDKFNYGNYKVLVYDDSTSQLIYSRTYSTLFNEWQTTKEAKLTTKTFSETFVLPYPKRTVRLEFYSRDKLNQQIKKFDYKINPENYFIKTERTKQYERFEVSVSGEPESKVDIVIIPEGYTIDQMTKFMEDAEKFAGYLFDCTPFKENKDKFNIWGVLAPSEDSGTDIPADDVWMRTIVNSAFYTFDLDRYLMTYDNKAVRTLASYAPYDQIFILVNSKKYGGGAIYNHYSVCVSDNRFSDYVFVHEFGHGFASLGDEYVTTEVAYEEFYSTEIEPLDPNLTTLVDFDSKWKDLVDDDVPIPTPPDKEYEDKVGAFEGGGYVPEGVYRPMQDCTMKSISKNNFCPVCKRAIIEMINFYTE
ncbi:MAG: peptidase M64 [Ignavibacterium sp.]|nr:MAG: peptidase M64 [Ignavibacterium sp.]